MSASSLLTPGSNKINPAFMPLVPVGAIRIIGYENGSGIVVSNTTNVTLPFDGLYGLQTYIAKGGVGANDSTTTTTVSCTAGNGWGQTNFTPSMITPAAEGETAASMTSTFTASAGDTQIVVTPGTGLNVGANGNLEYILWYFGTNT